ncbi:MAG TPA: hypothetical protein VGL38_14280 [bacterium]|jgi:hypothetical protein
MLKRFAAVCVLVLTYVLLLSSAWAQSVLTMPVSPRAIGRAGVYTSADNADPLAALSNPGLLGILAGHNRLMAAFYPQQTHYGWRDPYYGEYHVSSRVVQLGLNESALHWKLPVSIGIGYHESVLDILFPSDVGHEAEFNPHADSKGFSIGVGAHYAGIELGLGFNEKKYTSMWGHGERFTSSDYGVFVQAPWHTRLPYAPEPATAEGLAWTAFLTPSAAYSLLNAGSRYGPNQEMPERTARQSFALATGINARHPAGGEWRVLSLEGGIEGEDLLIDDSDVSHIRYQNGFGDIDPVNDLLLGQSNALITKRTGYEISIGELFYLRGGHYAPARIWRSVHASTDVSRYETDGYGFRLSGCLKALTLLPTVRENRAVSYIAQHLDVQYDAGKTFIRDRNAPSPYGRPLPKDVTFRELAFVFTY